MIQFREIIIAAFEAMATPSVQTQKFPENNSTLKILRSEDTERLKILTLSKMKGADKGPAFPYRCKLTDPKL